MTDTNRLTDRIRELDAENDRLARENADLRRQLEANNYGESYADRELALVTLVHDLYDELELESPNSALMFYNRVSEYVSVREPYE